MMLVDRAGSIDDAAVAALREASADAGRGEKAAWFAGWHEDAKAIVFLDGYFKEMARQGTGFPAVPGPETATAAVRVLLALVAQKFFIMDEAFRDARALAVRLGKDSAEKKRLEFMKAMERGSFYLGVAGAMAGKAADPGDTGRVLMWEGVYGLSEYDLRSIFEGRESVVGLCASARDRFERAIASAGDPLLRARCYLNIAKSWYDDDLEKTLEYLRRGRAEAGRATTGEAAELCRGADLDISRVLLRLGRPGECFDLLSPIIGRLEAELAPLAAPGALSGFLERNGAFYAAMVAACAGMGKSDPAYHRLGLEYAEKANSRMILETWKKPFTVDESIDPGLYLRRKKLLDDLEGAGADAGPGAVAAYYRIADEIGAIEQAFWKKSRTKAYNFNARPATFEEIVRLVPPDAVLLEFFAAEDRFFAFVVDGDGLRDVKEIGLAPDEAREIIGMANLAIGCRMDYTAYQALHGQGIDLLWADPVNLGYLYDRLIRPVWGYMEGKKALYIVPHGALRNVPFQALYRIVDGEKRYLVEDIAICYAPSSSILRVLSGRSRSLATCRSLGVSQSMGGPYNALREAGIVAGLFKGTGEHATVGAVLGAAGSCDVLHLACHSSDQSAVSSFNGLVLEDGVLYPKDIRHVHCSLVTLSACRTFADDAAETREMAGLAGSFLSAGARSVAASLWPVHSGAAEVLMAEFYRCLAGGNGRAEALRRGQLEVMRSFSDHPLFWAPFVLVGADDGA